MDAEAQTQIQFRRTNLDQQIFIAGTAQDPVIVGREDRLGRGIAAHEAHRIARPQLTELPAFVGYHYRRADETAAAGTVGSEQDWHVTGEIDGADRVGVVMDVGWMQSGFATIATGEARLGPDQPHTSPVAVVVHLVGMAVKRGHVVASEEFRRSMRPLEHAELPRPRAHRAQRLGQRRPTDCKLLPANRTGQRYEISHRQAASGMASEIPQIEGRLAAQIGRYRQAPTDGEIPTATTLTRRAALQQRSGGYRHRRPQRQGNAIEHGRSRCTAETDDGRDVKAQLRPDQGEFQACHALVIAHQAIGQPERAIVERPARRHADIPVALASGPVLDRGQQARMHHFERARCGSEVIQIARRDQALGQTRKRGQQACGIGDGAAQVQFSRLRAESCQRLCAIAASDRQHGQLIPSPARQWLTRQQRTAGTRRQNDCGQRSAIGLRGTDDGMDGHAPIDRSPAPTASKLRCDQHRTIYPQHDLEFEFGIGRHQVQHRGVEPRTCCIRQCRGLFDDPGMSAPARCLVPIPEDPAVRHAET